MKPETALLWWYLNVLPKRKRYDMLVDCFGSLDEATANMTAGMLGELGCREETAADILRKKEEFDPGKYAAEMERRNIRLLSIEDDAYPECLRTIGDAPVFLSYHGDITVLHQPLIGLVGTRDMSPYGKRVTGAFVPDFVRAGVVTVSGLALGIDAEIAKETLAAGGRTVAVLGGGLGAIYPKSNERLAEEIVAKGGLLISEFPLGMEPTRYTFPARNRIIAGLSLGTVVLEAPVESGAIITAELALDYNRGVYAVPGPVFEPRCEGCHALVRRGEATLVTSATDVLQDIGIMASSRAETVSFIPTNGNESAVWNVLTAMPQCVDDLVERSGLPASSVFGVLTVLELQGVAANIGGGQWVRG